MDEYFSIDGRDINDQRTIEHRMTIQSGGKSKLSVDRDFSKDRSSNYSCSDHHIHLPYFSFLIVFVTAAQTCKSIPHPLGTAYPALQL